jgi:carboxyl-terminal processing protease
MNKQNRMQMFLRILSYILVAVLASAVTWFAAGWIPDSKLERLSAAIEHQFIGEADQNQLQDAAAEAMIAAMGDRWSYYVSAEEYAAHRQRQKNSYVGIGIAVQLNQEGKGIQVTSVTPGGPAEEAGMQAGDIITHADGVCLTELTLNEGKALITGEKNTKVVLMLLRGEETIEMTVTRKEIHRKHIFTHIIWNMKGIYLDVAECSGAFQWLTEEEINTQAALPTAFRLFWEEK